MKYLLFFFLFTQVIFCQVNTEKYRNFGDSIGFKGIINFAASIQTGNTDLQKLGSEIRLDYHKPSSTILLILKGEYGWNNGVQFSNGALAHLRFTGTLNPNLKLEFFGQTNYDKSLKLQFRALSGAGLRIKLFEAEHSVLWFGSAYMLEYENYEKPRRVIDKREITSSRWSNYLSYNLIVQNNVIFSLVIYYQPRFDLWKDARILTENSLIVNLSGSFSLSVELDLRYDRFPVEDLKNTDINSTVGLIYNF